MPELTGGEAVYEALRALDVRHVFGIVSVHNIPIYDAIRRGGGIEAIAVRHEQAAVHAADGYARATGRLGVAIASTGPGTTNAMTGLFEAASASSPVLLVTGQIESVWYGKGKGFLHEAERQLDMLRTVCREAATVRYAEEIGEQVVRAGLAAQRGRQQPCAVEIPIDLQYRRTQIPIPFVEGPPRLAPDPGSLERAAEAIARARRRLIWAGGGVVAGGAHEALLQLAERLAAPVFTTINGRGSIPETHPLAMGPLTNHPAFEELFRDADLLIAVGTRFHGAATRNWSLRLPPNLVHIDVDPGVIHRNYPASVPVVGDASRALTELLRLLDATENDRSFTERALAIRDEVRAQIRRDIGPDYEAIMDAIRELTPDDGIMVRDATVPAYLWGNRILPILRPRTSIYPASAAIGPGLPLAVGAATGTGRRTVLIQGDGGFMLSVGELATLVQYDLPVTILLFNDRGYGVLRTIQARTFEGRTIGVDLVTPDFVRLAESFGVWAERVASPESFRRAFEQALARPGPALLEIDMSQLRPMAGLGSPPRRA